MNDGGGVMGARYVVEGGVFRRGRGWEKNDVRVGPSRKEGWDVRDVVGVV